MRRERKTSGSELSMASRALFLATSVAAAMTWGAVQAQAADLVVGGTGATPVILDWHTASLPPYSSYTAINNGELRIYQGSLPAGTTVKLAGTDNASAGTATLSFLEPYRYANYNVNLRVEGAANVFSYTYNNGILPRNTSNFGNAWWGRQMNVGSLTLAANSALQLGGGNAGGAISFTGTTLEGDATLKGPMLSFPGYIASVADLGTVNTAGHTLTLTSNQGGSYGGIPSSYGCYQISSANAWQNAKVLVTTANVKVMAANAKLGTVSFSGTDSGLWFYADQDTTAGATLPASVIPGNLKLVANIGSHYNGLTLGNGATVTNATTLVGSMVAPPSTPLTYASNLVLNGSVNVEGGAGLTLAGNLSGVIGQVVAKSGLIILSGNNGTLGGDAAQFNAVLVQGGNVRIANALALPNYYGENDWLEIRAANSAIGLAYDPGVAGGIPTSIVAPLLSTAQAIFAIDTTAWTTNITPTNTHSFGTSTFRVGSTGIGKTTGSIDPLSGTYYLGGGGGTLELAKLNVLTGANNVNIGANGTIKLSNANNTTGTITLPATGNLVLAHTNAIQNATLALSLSSIDPKGQVASTSGALLVDPTAGNVTGNITRNSGPIGFTGDKTLSSYSDLPGAWGTTVYSAVVNPSGTPTDVINFGGGAAGTTTFNFAAGDHGSNPVAFYLNAPAATVKFTQANTFSGGTVLAAGTLELSDPSQLPGKLVFAGTVNTPARIHATQTMTLNNPIDGVAAYQKDYAPAGGNDARFLVDDGKFLTLTGIVSPDAFGNAGQALVTTGLYKEGLGTLVYSPSNGAGPSTANANNAGFIVAGGVLETAYLPYSRVPGYEDWNSFTYGSGLRLTPNGRPVTFRFTGSATTGWHPGLASGSATNSGFSEGLTVDRGMGVIDVTDSAGVVRIWTIGGPAITMNDGANLVKTGPGTLSLNSRCMFQWDPIFPFTGASVDVQQGVMAFNDIPIPNQRGGTDTPTLMHPDAQVTYKVQNGATLQVYRYNSDPAQVAYSFPAVVIAGDLVLNDEYTGVGTPEAKVAGVNLAYTGATTLNGTWRVIAGSASLPVTAAMDTIWDRRAGATVRFGVGANLAIDTGATFNANGTVDAFTDTISGQHLPITNNGVLMITWGDKAPATIDGTGAVSVGPEAGVATSGLPITLTADYIKQSALSMVAGTKVSIRSNGSNTSFLGTISVAGGTLDLANNDMLVASGGVAQEHAVSSHLLGLVAPTGSSLINTTGVMTGATYTALVGPTFHGQSVGADALVLKYTVAGDANFDGIISMDDYLAIDAGYLMGGSNWVNGDFNHDGVVNAKDYALIDFNNLRMWGRGGAATMEALHTNWFGADYTIALADLTSAVPEPASLLLLGAGLTCLLRRRR